MFSVPENLPVSRIIAELKTELGLNSGVVLQAPPGAGKTTCVPLALKDETWLSGKQIIMLEPRRLAARASAMRMAENMGEPLEKTVGYHVRNDRKTGPETRIIVVTEGIFIRMIQHDPELSGIGLVIFDEFHERNLNSDLALALTLESRDVFSEHLKILVMSATLDMAPVSELMNQAPVICSEGRSYPVETLYFKSMQTKNPEQYSEMRKLEDNCLFLIGRVLSEHTGDILVFLPGAGEINRLLQKIRNSVKDTSVSVYALYGNLSKKDQDAAIRASIPGKRKIVLATPIAETSLTIEGITCVIDTGLARYSRFYSGTGMSRLETRQISQASADQRKGRAGRTQAGFCYRMWGEEHHLLLTPHTPPEINQADLAPVILELALWGVHDFKTLMWLDHPPEGNEAQAKQLLTELGALDPGGNITSHGKKTAGMGIHSRLAHMMIKAQEAGKGLLACQLAALLHERDFIQFPPGEKNSDIRLRLEVLNQAMGGKKRYRGDLKLKQGVLSDIIKSVRRFYKALKLSDEIISIDDAASLVALAYPDRVARQRDGRPGEFQMTSGSGAALPVSDLLAAEPFLAIAGQSGDRQNSRIYLAASYRYEDLVKDFSSVIRTEKTVLWNKKNQRVEAREKQVLINLVLKEKKWMNPDPEKVCKALIAGIRLRGMSVLSFHKSVTARRSRMIFLFLSGFEQDLPDLRDQALLDTLEIWLKPWIHGITSLAALQKLDFGKIFDAMLTWKQKQILENQAPTHITVPSGSRIPLSYDNLTGKIQAESKDHTSIKNDLSPVLAVRLQEMFGLQGTPMIAGGRIPVTIHLLSPAGRPVQVTQDLGNFWKQTYKDVKKDLKGRYPKHYWPDDPFNAVPTNRVRPKK